MQISDVAVEGARNLAPIPVGLGGLVTFGVALPVVIQILTVIWLLVLIAEKLPGVLRRFCAWLQRRKDNP
jgi:hypothetical protein